MGAACAAAPADPNTDWVLDMENGDFEEMTKRLRSGDPNKMPTDINLPDADGMTALHKACAALDGLEDEDLFNVLDFIREAIKDFGADVNNNSNKSKMTPLHITVQTDDATAAYTLIAFGFKSKGLGGPINVDLPNNQGLSAKAIADKNGDSSKVHQLLDGNPVKVWVYDDEADFGERYSQKTVKWSGDDKFEEA